ncbi:MAG: hypothetical protein ACRDBR_02140 [Metamycoplasmataceae bacterium]
MHGMEVIRLVVVPIISLITGIMAVIILFTTYYIVFKLRKYLKRYKSFLSFTNKLNNSFLNKNIIILRAYKTIMWGPLLEETKTLIGPALDNYKKSDIKDLILGTYKEEFNAVRKTINKNYYLVRNNAHFLQFQRLFYVHQNKEIKLEYFDENYLSFFKIEKNSVLIGVISKTILEEIDPNYLSNYDVSNIFKEQLIEKSTIYRVFFFKNKFTFKEVQNGFPEFEEKLNKIKTFYSLAVNQKYHTKNVYIYDNLKGLDKLQSLLKKENTQFKVVDDLLLEQVYQKTKIIDNSFIKDKRERKLAFEDQNKNHKKHSPFDNKKTK